MSAGTLVTMVGASLIVTGTGPSAVVAAGQPIAVPSSECELYSYGGELSGELGDGPPITPSYPIREYQLPAGEVIDTVWPFDAVETTSGALYMAGSPMGSDVPVQFPLNGETVADLQRVIDFTAVLTTAGTLWVDGSFAFGGAFGSAGAPVEVAIPGDEAVVEVELMPYLVSNRINPPATQVTELWLRTASGKVYQVTSAVPTLTEIPVGYTDTNSVWVPRAATNIELTTGGAMIVDQDGRLYGIGENSVGELGLGLRNPALTTTDVTTVQPVLPEGEVVADLYVYGGLWRVRTAAGAVWRSNAGVATTIAFPPGTVITSLLGVYGPAITSTGDVYVIAANGTPTLVALPPGEAIDTIYPGPPAFGVQMLVLMTSGKVYGYGVNNFGQLGVGDTAPATALTPTILPPGTVVVDVVNGGLASYFLTSTGQIWAAGTNNFGNLGVQPDANPGTNDPTPTPVQMIVPAGMQLTPGDSLAGTAIITTPIRSAPPLGSFSFVLCPFTSTLTVTKTLEGDGVRPTDGWSISVASPNCVLPAQGTTLTIPTNGGTVTFEHLQIWLDPQTPCTYTLSEATVNGWTPTFTPSGPYTLDGDTTTVTIGLLNTSPTSTSTTTTTTTLATTTTTSTTLAATTTAATTTTASGSGGATPTTATHVLPDTGSDGTSLWYGLAALTAGAALVAAARRPRRAHR